MIIKLKDIDKINPDLSSKIFIYPTDTIYGIGCDANKKKLVDKIRLIKNRDNKPFSIIAPSKKYIFENFIADKKLVNKYLPGPYTLLLRKKDKNFLSHVSDNEFIGVRIPNHEFTKFLQKINLPIVTTSVNISGQSPANSVDEINKKILSKVDFIFDSGMLSGKPSTLIKNGEEIRR